MKQLFEVKKNMKSLWKVKGFDQQIYCLQHKTAQRVTARHSVIHTSLLLLSPLLYHTLVSSPAWKVPYFQVKYWQEISMVASPKSRGLLVKIKNAGWNHFGPHGKSFTCNLILIEDSARCLVDSWDSTIQPYISPLPLLTVRVQKIIIGRTAIQGDICPNYFRRCLTFSVVNSEAGGHSQCH